MRATALARQRLEILQVPCCVERGGACMCGFVRRANGKRVGEGKAVPPLV